MTFSNRNGVRKLSLLFALPRNASSSFPYHNGRRITSRPFEYKDRKVADVLESKGLYTSSNEIRRAIVCLYTYDPDAPGALKHARAALECVAREVTGYRRLMLKDILDQVPDMFPDPYVKEVVLKLWGYMSDKGVHRREGDDPTYDEAELVVGVSNALCLYLARKYEPNKYKDN